MTHSDVAPIPVPSPYPGLRDAVQAVIWGALEVQDDRTGDDNGRSPGPAGDVDELARETAFGVFEALAAGTPGEVGIFAGRLLRRALGESWDAFRGALSVGMDGADEESTGFDAVTWARVDLVIRRWDDQ